MIKINLVSNWNISYKIPGVAAVWLIVYLLFILFVFDGIMCVCVCVFCVGVLIVGLPDAPVCFLL